MVKFTRSRPEDGAGGGPSSSIGIMRFFDADSKSPKLNPYFVIGGILVLAVVVLVLKRVIGM